MSTRSIIVITNQDKTIRLYKHSDGYPTENLRVIGDAVRKYYRDFNKDADRRTWLKESADALAGYIIKETVNLYGIGSFVEEVFYGPLNIAEGHLGIQEDLEWIYVVDMNNKSVGVYGGRWTGTAPHVAYSKGNVDPFNYVSNIKDEFKSRERKEIARAIDRVYAAGFRVNKPARFRKTLNDSSIVRKVEYRNSNLTIALTNGTKYRYLRVPPSTAFGLVTAYSKGSFFNQNVKGKFESKKLA